MYQTKLAMAMTTKRVEATATISFLLLFRNQAAATAPATTKAAIQAKVGYMLGGDGEGTDQGNRSKEAVKLESAFTAEKRDSSAATTEQKATTLCNSALGLTLIPEYQ